MDFFSFNLKELGRTAVGCGFEKLGSNKTLGFPE